MSAANIGNTYLNAPRCEKIWSKDGPDFVSQQGCAMLIVISIYGLNSSGASWREILAETLGKEGLGYSYTAIDKDVWIKRGVLPDEK